MSFLYVPIQNRIFPNRFYTHSYTPFPHPLCKLVLNLAKGTGVKESPNLSFNLSLKLCYKLCNELLYF